MVRFLTTAVTAAVAFSSWASAQQAISCSPSHQCPESLPCCSQYGQCGVGAYCLGGCDPISSFSLRACTPAPICQSKEYKFDSLDGITPNTQYLGDASKSDWVSSGEPKVYEDGNGKQVLLTMPEHSVGTLLASTSYVWYGNIKATMKTSRGQGVVTAFILLSDVKDEVDYEFIGSYLDDAQSNYYWHGVPIYDKEKNISVSDTFGTYHTYEIDWTPDTLTWSFDGKAYRTVKRSDTFNQTSKVYNYPQTPSRVQLSLWPAGLASNGDGTVNWAGGLVQWNAPDVANAGYYYAMVKDVTIKCYDPPSGAHVEGSKAYIYTDKAGTEDTVKITDDNTVMQSFLDSGLNMDANKPSGSAAPAVTDAPTVPGLSGVGTGSNGLRGGGDNGTSSSTVAGPAAANPTDPTQSGFHGYVQGATNPTGAGSSFRIEAIALGSVIAGLVAGVFLVM